MSQVYNFFFPFPFPWSDKLIAATSKTGKISGENKSAYYGERYAYKMSGRGGNIAVLISFKP